MDITGFFAQLPPIFPILMLTFVLLIVGSVVVLLFSGGGKKSKQKKAKSEPALEAVPMAAPAAPKAAATPAIAPAAPPRSTGAHPLTLATGERVEAIEVMVLLRDIADGRLIAQIGERAFACPPENADAEFLRQFAIAARDLSAAAGDAPRPSRPAPATPIPAIPSVPMPAETEWPPLDDAPPLDALFVASDAPPPPAQAAGAMPGDLPKYVSPKSAEPPRLGRRPTAVSIPEINIAASIEAFLQYRLSADGRFATRSIHVLPAGADGVRIEVDGQNFEHIDDISDPIVQAFLRQTIAEWQSRQ